MEFLVVLIILVGGLAWWVCRPAPWYVQRNKESVGPLTTSELAQLYTTGQIPTDSLIRQARDKQWTTGVVMQHPAPRVRTGLRWGLLGLVVGFAVGYGIFGRVMGTYISVSYIFRAEKSAENAIAAELAAKAIPIAGPVYSDIGGKLETARTLVLVTTLVLGILGGVIGGALAKGSFKIVKGRTPREPQVNPNGELG